MKIVVTLFPNQNITTLSKDWCELYRHSKQSFFLDWQWISNWLLISKLDYTVIRAESVNKVVGLGIVITQNVPYLLFYKKCQKILHRTGVPKFDQMWIEYNDFLVQESNSNEIRNAMFEAIVESESTDEIVIGVSQQSMLATLKNTSVHKTVFSTDISHKIDFSLLSKNNNNFNESLSKNTRHAISRSNREYEKHGALRLSLANSAEEAVQWFMDCRLLHEDRWKDTPQGSGFSNEAFVTFHQQLIKTAFPNNQIHLLKISCGETVIAYLYNFIEKKSVKFYLSAIDYDAFANNKVKPGLTSHLLAIEYYLENGYEEYDFMAGDSQYKRSLANASEVMEFAIFRKNSWIFSIEEQLKSLKQKIENLQFKK